MTCRLANGLVVGIVVAVGTAAVASAFLGGGNGDSKLTDSVAQPPAETDGAEEGAGETGAELAVAARALEQNGVVGTLALIDEDCKFQALTLPGLLPTAAERPARCSFPRATGEPRPAGHPFFQVPSAPDPRCRVRGCAYAWKPGGTATFVRAGEVVEIRSRCDRSVPCARVALSRADLAAAFGGASRARVRDLAWLTDERLLAIVRTRRGSSRDVIALFDGPRLLAWARVPSVRLSLIRLSPSRRIAAVGSSSHTRIWLVRPRRGGLTVMPFPPWPPPAPTELRAIAWSPDDRWTALATRRTVYVFRTGRAQDGYIGIPLAVRDVRLD